MHYENNELKIIENTERDYIRNSDITIWTKKSKTLEICIKDN